MEFPPFGVLLERLLDHRGSDTASLAQAAGVPESELGNVIAGLRPSPELLRALAPALDLHAADLFVLAAQRVPDDLTPLDGSFYCRRYLDHLMSDTNCLPADQRAELRRLAQEMPQEPRRRPYVPWKWYDPHKAGLGALVGNLLFANRNLSGSEAAPILAFLSPGRRYVSSTTVVMVGTGHLELTPDWLADLSALIDIPAGDLAAITGIPLPDGSLPEDPAAADAAALLWDVRRLSAEQLWKVCVRAEEMRYAQPEDALAGKARYTGPYRVSRNPPLNPDS
ncbi:helix-turn-helix transcriptional regulator [Spirillospora sp. NPDC029432]|uniref:helix-turn-helix transcriptional regulator n=1 Tax=Spirillospora sp. NPDC029432 TaxID=3154599 RepID=UPI003456F473